jgi:CheY-like chemotaxis protein
VRLDESYVAGHDDVTPGQYVMIAVSDTGSGMTPEVRAQAFEPFYTTKGPGKGSGLGLSVVYGFVKQSGGHVKIYSEPGEGTTVKLYLPRSDAPAVAPAPADQPPETGGMERILVVEDDDLVRSHVTQQVQGLGYSVVAAANGPEAIAILRSGEPFDLLFTDVVMPGGMNGREVAEEAQRLRPGLRVLFTSGYTESAIVHHGRLDRGVHLINKPYRRQDLARKLRQVLDEPVGPVGGKAGDGAGQ